MATPSRRRAIARITPYFGIGSANAETALKSLGRDGVSGRMTLAEFRDVIGEIPPLAEICHLNVDDEPQAKE